MPGDTPDRLRILTFNTHEAFSYELAKTGHAFDVVWPPTRAPWAVEWDERSRPIPPNVNVLGHRDLARLDTSAYDLLLAQTLEQFDLVEFRPVPKLLLLHTPFESPPGWPSAEAALRHLGLERRLRDVPVVYVSEYCRRSWGLPGRVVPAPVDERDYAAYPWHGRRARGLTVCHFFRERDFHTGYALHRQVVGDLPFTVIGHNPTLPGSAPAGSWDELRRAYQAHRVYLNTTRLGGGLALTEAAAAGMPIVTTPRVDGARLFTAGYDALIAGDAAGLRAAVIRLFENPSLGRLLGTRARCTVTRLRGLSAFADAWEQELRGAVAVPVPVAAPGLTDDELPGLRASLEVAAPADPPGWRAGALVVLDVRLRNAGATAWPCHTREHAGEVRLSYHWLDRHGRIVEWEGVRTPLPADVPPGGELRLPAVVRVPAEPGAYTLRWDLVAEFRAWFSARGGVAAPDVRVDAER